MGITVEDKHKGRHWGGTICIYIYIYDVCLRVYTYIYIYVCIYIYILLYSTSFLLVSFVHPTHRLHAFQRPVSLGPGLCGVRDHRQQSAARRPRSFGGRLFSRFMFLFV